MIVIKIDDIEKNIDLRHCLHDWQFFNVIETGKDGLGQPVSQHSVPSYFFELGGKIRTGGHVYEYQRRVGYYDQDR